MVLEWRVLAWLHRAARQCCGGEEKAKAAGVSQADAALKALRGHVEAQAAKGDMEARMLLQSWK